jgi:pimeloyl-ACP methyl ester carboxylesterase
MSLVENRGAKIYWDVQGQGEAVLLIMGLGWASNMWHRTRPVLTERYRTIAFDNRGAGRSDVPHGPYSIALLASDAAAVLDASGVERAHVLGVSMGGMIAQEFALQYPKRVRSLILGCTAAGGPRAVQADAQAIQLLFRRDPDPAVRAKAAVPFIYDSGTPRERIDQDLAVLREWYPHPEGYTAQLQAIMAWEADSRLTHITAPTLVIHGENDRLDPAANGRLIAERIPGAGLVVLPNASHIFMTDQPAAAHQAFLELLSAPHEKHSAIGKS